LPRLFIIFGNPGVGKSLAGSLLEEHFGFLWYDADVDVSPEMEECIKSGVPFSQEIRDKYFEKVVRRTHDFLSRAKEKGNNHVVLTQALIKRKNRDQFRDNFPNAEFLWIVTRDEIANGRIEIRQQELLRANTGDTFESHVRVGVPLATRIRQQFDNPESEENYTLIVNDGNISDLLAQLKRILI